MIRPLINLMVKLFNNLLFFYCTKLFEPKPEIFAYFIFIDCLFAKKNMERFMENREVKIILSELLIMQNLIGFPHSGR